jgi:hypothetical protein
MNATISPARAAAPPTTPLTPWSLRAWPPLWCQADRAAGVRFAHLGTHVAANGEHGVVSGQTLWGDDDSEHPAGVAWDWIIVADGVVAMADPMSLVTNVRLVGHGGEVLTAWQAARFLNEIVHQLPWQSEVERALREAA